MKLWRASPCRLGSVVAILCGAASAQEFLYIDQVTLVFRPGAEYLRPITWGDVNGDGAVDCVVRTGLGGSAAKLALNDGQGHLLPPVELPAPAALFGTHWGTQFPALIDLDRDGDLDLVTHLQNFRLLPPYPVALLNDGRGNFSLDTLPRFALATALLYARVDALDANGDGASDLLFYATSPRTGLWLCLNDGNGNFVDAPGAFGSLPPLIGDFAEADFDGDGDVDILFGHYSGLSFILENDGTGQFRQGFTFSSLMACYAARGIDIDRDGDADVVFGRQPCPPGMEIWLNDGRGHFTLDTQAFQSPWATHAAWIDALDFDADGDLDLFAPPALWLNDGSGRFTDATGRLQALGITAWMAFDLDRDGDADLMSGDSGLAPGTWWANTARQIHFAQDPQVGGTLQLDAYGAPGRLVTYLLGFARQDLHIPGIGWSALDPRLAVAWPLTASVPPGRKVSFTLPVPNQPSLRGLTLFAQSIDFGLGAGPRLANFTSCTIL